ncbi:tyrosine-type recombinase/integrase [Clostridium sp.]|uniref:tyrosine-type recombinase/integrase n=1 Tax=Clostridium sp. TaxID=1506 RepID=UPI0032173FAE
MNGNLDFNNKYLNKISNIVKDSPEYINGYYYYLNDLSITSRYSYINIVVNFMKFTNKDVAQLNFDDFLSYLSHIEYKENGEITTSSYKISVYSALKRFCTYLYSSKKINENYMLNVKRPKSIEFQSTIEKRNTGYLTKNEIKKYLYDVENGVGTRKSITRQEEWRERDSLIVLIFLTTGIRCSALMKLDVNNINVRSKSLMVTDKGSKTKIYTISDEVMNMYYDWIKKRHLLLDGVKEDALFISNQRTRMDQSSIYRIVKKYSKNIKGKNITPHKLRATYGTQLYNSTKDIYFVQECMGHSNPKTTEIYIRDKKNTTQKASSIISDIIGNNIDK